MGIFGLDPGAEINGLHIALDGVAAVKGGDTHLVLTGNSVYLFAVFKEVSLRFADHERRVGFGLDIEAPHVSID